VKKKQHSLTLLLICQADGKIIYASYPLLGSSDQRHWNELNLRDLFENKKYGIIGDSGFTFNHKDGEETRSSDSWSDSSQKVKKSKLDKNTKETK
jgi:hypothetical protein